MKVFKNILLLLGALLMAILFTRFVAMRSVVDGSSMEPTLYHGDQLFIDRISYRFHDPARYDIIVFPGIAPEEGGKAPYYIKRVIGLPGEEICIREGRVWINGTPLQEINEESFETMQDAGMAGDPYVIPDRTYFVLGDNRNHSRDSRDPLLGPVRREDLLGKVLVRIWPPKRIGWFK